jgi:hypothetical protein
MGISRIRFSFPRPAHPPQKVVRPPDVSKVDAVVKLHSADAMKHTIAADSSISPSRPIGIFERIYST